MGEVQLKMITFVNYLKRNPMFLEVNTNYLFVSDRMKSLVVILRMMFYSNRSLRNGCLKTANHLANQRGNSTLEHRINELGL